MPEEAHTTIDLSGFSWGLGETRTLELELHLPPIHLAGQDYRFIPGKVPASLTVTYVGRGYTIKMEFSCRLEGACWRCLEPANIDLDMSIEDF